MVKMGVESGMCLTKRAASLPPGSAAMARKSWKMFGRLADSGALAPGRDARLYGRQDARRYRVESGIRA
jgi:hypothetical protein